MVENKCNNKHKLGPYFKVDNGYTRNCLCCDYKSFYPETKEFANELKKQEDAENIFNVVLQDDVDNFVQSGDQFFEYMAIIHGILSYLFDINDETINNFIYKSSMFNNYYNNDNQDRFNAINDLFEYIKIYFKIQAGEIKYGIDYFSKEQKNQLDKDEKDIYEQLDELDKKIRNKFEIELAVLYDLNEKNHLSK